MFLGSKNRTDEGRIRYARSLGQQEFQTDAIWRDLSANQSSSFCPSIKVIQKKCEHQQTFIYGLVLRRLNMLRPIHTVYKMDLNWIKYVKTD